MQGRDVGKEGTKAELKAKEEMESQGVGDGRGGGVGGGGEVWRLADRTGYAQTESQAQAQT